MKPALKWLLPALVLGIAVAATAQNVNGAWKGKVLLDAAKLPKVTDPKQKQMMDRVLASVKKMTMHLNLKANKTFTIKVSDIPAGANGAKPKDETTEGTWTQKGSVITLKVTKSGGMNPKTQQEPQELQVTEGGKKLVLVPKGRQMMPGKIVFTR